MSSLQRLGIFIVLAASATTAVGCAPSSSASMRAARTARARAAAAAEPSDDDPSTCKALGSLVDLKWALLSSPTPSSSPLAALVDAEEELAYARAARQQLSASASASSSPRPSPMQESVTGLVAMLEARSMELRRATDSARDSYAAAESGLRAASTCRGIDLRELAKHKEKTQDVATARSKACEGPLRLWAATKRTELSSEVSTAGAAAQVGELRLDKESSLVRDRLVSALGAHARRLADLRTVSGSAGEASAQQELRRARSMVGEQIDDAYRGCPVEPAVAATARAGAGMGDPRGATVMVRPRWTGALEALAGGQRSFGSGFLVRWTRADGRAETLVVTNRHVIDGAVEASILSASEIDAASDRRDKREKVAPRSAHVVAADETDDIAVLRFDGEGGAAPLPQGLAFRSELPREQEVIVAAGFPGIGMMPSFQVTKGVVSNAHFASEERDTGIAYIQHTAPIDPGNSGGPLLDERGRLVGMNTAKLHGRENVSLAIPGARIRFALRRAEERRRLDTPHAEASCNVALEALASEHPSMSTIARFGLALFESGGAGGSTTRHHRDHVVGSADGPIDDARLRGYERVREETEASGGVLPFEACSSVTAAPAVGGHASFTASFRTRTGVVYRATLTEENDVVRLTALHRQR